MSLGLTLRAFRHIFDVAYVAETDTFGAECDRTEILGGYPSVIAEDCRTEDHLADIYIAETVFSFSFIADGLPFVQLKFVAFPDYHGISLFGTFPYIHPVTGGDETFSSLGIHGHHRE